MEVVNTLDIDGTQWKMQDVEARNQIVTLNNRVSAVEEKKLFNSSWKIEEKDNLVFNTSESGQNKTILNIPDFDLSEGGTFLLIINCIHFKVSSYDYQFMLKVNVNNKDIKIVYNNNSVIDDAIMPISAIFELEKGKNNLKIIAETTGGKDMIIYRTTAQPFMCTLQQLI